MKIAVLGKGGSGKSSLSWLLIKQLLANSDSVLAIDADHNMDLMVNLGLNTPPEITVAQSDKDFRSTVLLDQTANYKQLSKKSLSDLPIISIRENEFISKYSEKVDSQLTFMNGGLGYDQVLFGNKCAHGHLSPLKYMLPLINLKDNEMVVIDSVAGIDMVNFGLYAGVDAIIVVVNNHPHSVRVLEQIIRANDTIATPVYCVINKYDPDKDGQFLNMMRETYPSTLLGIIGYDEAILKLDYNMISSAIKENLQQIIDHLPAPLSREEAWSKVARIDELKLSGVV